MKYMMVEFWGMDPSLRGNTASPLSWGPVILRNALSMVRQSQLMVIALLLRLFKMKQMDK